jgi:hypothetical protein
VESGLGGSTAPLGVAGFEAGGAAQARRHLRTRLPTRGALGNGLRVVAGAVLASEGFLVVTTRNRRIELHPERDGTTTVVTATSVDFPVGTRVEIGASDLAPIIAEL